MGDRLQIRWLGRVPYAQALTVQRALFRGRLDHLLLLEHPPTYTLGVRADPANILVGLEDLGALGAVVMKADRGGDVTYHGPGQLVGYPILTVPGKRGGGMADTVAYVCGVERVLVDALSDLGLPGCGTRRDYPGVWVDPHGVGPRKIAAIGVKLTRGRSMHGFALNVSHEPLAWFSRIVPCGIKDAGVTSLAAEGVDVSMRDVVDAIARRAGQQWGRRPVGSVASSSAEPSPGGTSRAPVPASQGEHPRSVAPEAFTRADVAWGESPDDLSPFSRGAGPGSGGRALVRLAQAGVDSSTAVEFSARKPEWLRVKADMGRSFTDLRKTLRSLELVTVCEEAGCPNIHECWNAGTATFMVLGDRCTRACGFCLVDTRRPAAPDPREPDHVATAVERMGLAHAVLTMVARDDLPDGGAAHVAACIGAIRARTPTTRVEVLVSDLKGDAASIDVVLEARPDVFNHNLETVARLQRAVRPSAGYARSLAVLAQASTAPVGITVKSGMMVGLGETEAEVHDALVDVRAVGVRILTIGQYLRPTANHLPVARWWSPVDFDALRTYGYSLGFDHVEASPLTRSSYHAREGADAALTAR